MTRKPRKSDSRDDERQRAAINATINHTAALRDAAAAIDAQARADTVRLVAGLAFSAGVLVGFLAMRNAYEG